MNWIDEVKFKIKKNNQVLFSKDSQFLQDLILLFQEQSHRVMVLWAFDFAAESINKLKEKYPNENRPQEALNAVRDWAAGKIKNAVGTTKNFVLPCVCKRYWQQRRYCDMSCYRTSLFRCTYGRTCDRLSDL